MMSLRKRLGWGPRKKLDNALKDWWRESKLEKSLLTDALSKLYSMEEYYSSTE